MDPKTEMTSVDLAALAGELSRYEGAKVDKVYLYGDDLVRFKLRDYDRGRVELLVETGDVKRCHVADPARVPDAPGRPPEFAKTLRSRLAGGELADAAQFEFDRILTFDFERPDENTRVVAELFGEGNVAVLDDTGEVQRSLETVRLKSRTVAPGSRYEFPQSRVNPFDVRYEVFEARMEESDTDVVRTLATQLNMGGLYAEEFCTRAGVEKTLDIADADEEQYRPIHDAIERMGERLRAGDLDPRVYLEDDAVVDVTPFPLEEREGVESEAYDDFNAALDEYFHRLDLTEDEEVDDAPDFEAEIAKKQRIIDQQEGAIDDFEERAEAEREKAEAVYAHYDLVDDVLSTIQAAREEGRGWEEIDETFLEGADRGIPEAEAVRGVDGSAATVEVDLDGTVVTLDALTGPEKNADRLYTEAKRIEGKKEGALEAIENTREELEAVKRRKEEWAEGDGDSSAGDGETDDAGEADADGDEDAETDWLSRSSIPVKRHDYWYDRFRWFETSDGFLVIGGRNADQNEELVKNYMEGDDLFCHAQAHGGPVTLIKATDPSEAARDVTIPESSREEAAQFAVSYSSVWKDGRGAGDAYVVTPDQVSKTPESGEYIEKGGFVIRGDRDYYRDVPAEVAVGVQAEPETRVVGGPPSAVEPRAATTVRLTPGRFAQNDAAMKCYRILKDRFADDTFVRKVASADLIQEFLPPGESDVHEG
ncbi:NFACT family protein [Halobaculum sp. CBA1158]|uniref:ribosome rescue protein RqcH n=1 Tax=Halobaculum sp. CBA1158 TaxID=2904243 RepID=UPI001F3C87D1|nr:ribosome rescue protein RqcH [Halobaculum sp. CBA1158]UIO98696.1 NFACT family protein [Halobaculum sp. CBA1158]